MRSSARKHRGPPSWTSDRSLIVPVLLLALGLRLYRLGDANLWWDEALAIWAVRKGLLGATLWTAGDVHPPLYFWSLWAWVRAFGESEFAMRALSAFAGVLTVAVVYRLGSLVGRHAVGLVAALLTASARFNIWWSQEMRMYALAGLLGTASLYLFLRLLRAHELDKGSGASPTGRGGWVLWGAYVAAATGALYTIFLSGAFLLAQNAVVLIALLWPNGYRKRLLLIRWVVAQLAIGALVALWLLLSWSRMPTWSSAEPLSLLAFLRLCVTLLSTGISIDVARYTWPALFPLLVVALGALVLAARWRQRPGAARRELVDGLALIATLLAAGAAIYSASLPRSLFYTPSIEARYVVPFAPAFWVLLAWCACALARRWRMAGGAALAGLLLIWGLVLPGYYRGRILRDDLQSLTRAILSQAEAGDAVLLDSGGRYPLFLYPYERTNPGLWRPPVLAVSFSEDPLDASQVAVRLPEIIEQHRRIWLAEVDVGLTDPDRLVRHWLQDHLRESYSQPFGSNTLLLFDPQGEPPQLRADGYLPTHVADPQSGHDVHLMGWDLPVQTFAPGDELHMATLWRQIPDESVALVLKNPLGQTVQLARVAAPALPGSRRMPLSLGIDRSLPSGAYELWLPAAPARVHRLAAIRVIESSCWPHAAGPTLTLNAQVGEHLTLEGFTLLGRAGRLDPSLAPGEPLIVDLYWRALASPAGDYTVFVHLIGQAHNPKTNGPLWGQHDSPPANGRSPTGQWVAGDALADRHVLVVDAGAPAGAYRLAVGMYDREGQRLPIRSQTGTTIGDHLLLEPAVEIAPR